MPVRIQKQDIAVIKEETGCLSLNEKLGENNNIPDNHFIKTFMENVEIYGLEKTFLAICKTCKKSCEVKEENLKKVIQEIQEKIDFLSDLERELINSPEKNIILGNGIEIILLHVELIKKTLNEYATDDLCKELLKLEDFYINIPAEKNLHTWLLTPKEKEYLKIRDIIHNYLKELIAFEKLLDLDSYLKKRIKLRIDGKPDLDNPETHLFEKVIKKIISERRKNKN